ncbi:MAG: hypothetical protein P1U57_08855, partial [Oleibacter sp.]|nr:hypothetical protein [Thalassolituus sp.]
MKLVQWKLRHEYFDQQRYRSYGLHHIPNKSLPSDHRVDFCLSIDGVVETNEFGITESIIPSCRCALARDVGSRSDNQAVQYLVHK